MKAVLLAGGRGSRFGDITLTVPNPLIKVGGKELIRHVLDVLPFEVTECVIVLGYLGHLIRACLGDRYDCLVLSYVYQDKSGTGGALLSAEPLMRKEEFFLTAGCDDIFGKNELSKLVRSHPAYGIFFGTPGKNTGIEVSFDSKNIFRGFKSVAEASKPRYFGVGAYLLPNRIFDEEFFPLQNGELSIPHTLARCSFPVEVVIVEKWMPVNDLAEKEVAEKGFVQ